MNEDDKRIFTKKALERIASSEQLTDYPRVTSPSVWIVLAALVTLIGGLAAWAAAGTLETTADAKAYVEDGIAYASVIEHAEINSDMTLRINSREYDIAYVDTNEYGMPVAYAPTDLLADGVYDAQIVLETISPVSFLFK